MKRWGARGGLTQAWRRQPRAEKERLRKGEGEGREGCLRQREQHGKHLEVQRM